MQKRTSDASSKAPTSLPPGLRRTTAILEVPNERAPSGTTRLYILAMSHVSAVSCDRVRDLIRAVQPDVVSVELCKDRLGLLASDFPAGPRVWHCPQVTVSGAPEGSGFPTKAELEGMLTCKPGKPFTSDDIEADVRTLQATGIFGAVRPSASQATKDEAPLFLLTEGSDGELELLTVPPFASLDFRCEARRLPPLQDFHMRVSSHVAQAGVALPQGKLQSIRDTTLKAAEGGESKTVGALMNARARVIAEAGSAAPVEVVFNNADTGKVDGVIVLRARDQSAVHTGLEATAEGGEGLNIETFQNPNRGDDVQIGLTSALPSHIVEQMARQASVQRNDNGAMPAASTAAPDNDGPASSSGMGSQQLRNQELEQAVARGRGRTKWRRWTWRELATAADEDPEPQPLKDLLANTLSQRYGGLQNRAGDLVGIEGGDAWRVRYSCCCFVGRQCA